MQSVLMYHFAAPPYLFSISTVFGHHFSQCLQNFDAQPLFILLQQLFGVFDQPVEMLLDKRLLILY